MIHCLCSVWFLLPEREKWPVIQTHYLQGSQYLVIYSGVFMAIVLFSALFSIHSLPVRVLKHLSCVWLILLSVLSPQLCSVISAPTSSFHYMQSVSFIIFLSGVIPPLFCLFTFYGRFPVFRPPHVASRVQCVWAPVSGSPVLWAKWSRLLWETLWHGEGIKDWPPDSWLLPRVSLLPVWPPYKGYTNIEVNRWSFMKKLSDWPPFWSRAWCW